MLENIDLRPARKVEAGTRRQELEGSGRWIDRTARKLGFTTGDYITLSYSSLYLAWCNEHRVTPTNMVFSRRKSPPSPSRT